MKILAAILLSASCALPSSIPFVSGASSTYCAGGPPLYCARTDGAPTVFFPVLFTGLTGAGSIVVDPFTGERVARITDYNTDASVEFLTTPSASVTNNWNSTNDRFYLVNQGQQMYIYAWNAAKMSATLLGSELVLPGGALTDGAVWGYQAADNLTLFTGDKDDINGHLYLRKLTIPACSTAGCITDASFTSTTLMDFSTDCALGSEFTQDDVVSDIDVSHDDQHIMWVLGGGGNNGRIVGVWDGTKPAGQQCSWYNMVTGQVGGTYGVTTPTAVVNVPSMPAPPALTVTSGTNCPTTGPGQICAVNSAGQSLIAGHTYNVYAALDYSGVGETPVSPAGSITLPAGTNAIEVSEPAAPTGYQADHFSVFACDAASCAGGPWLQQDISQAQPVIASCTGTGVTLWVQGSNQHFHSVPSASATTGYGGTCALSSATTWVPLLDEPWQSMNFGPSYPTTGTSIAIPSNRAQESWSFTGWNGSDGAVMTVGAILTNSPTAYAAPGRAGMSIHEAQLSRNAQWVMAVSQRQTVTAANFGSVVYWQVGTANVVGCSISSSLQSQAVISNTFGCDGHEATGYNAEINVRQQGAGSPCSPTAACGANDNILTPYSTCAAPGAGAGAGCTNSLIATGITGLVNTTPSPYFFMDSHQSWMNDNPADSEPILVSNGTMSTPSSGRAWNDEVDAMTAIPVGGTPGPVYRFTVNGASDAASAFFYASPRGNVSQDGKWFMFTSDMEEYNTTNNAPGFGLGAIGGGSSTCIPYGNSGANCRIDVFIVELK